MIAQFYSDLRKWLEVRSAVRAMERLDDRALDDIGVTRATIRKAALYGLN